MPEDSLQRHRVTAVHQILDCERKMEKVGVQPLETARPLQSLLKIPSLIYNAYRRERITPVLEGWISRGDGRI